MLDLTAKTIQQSPIEEIDSGEDIKADGSIVTFIKTARKPYDRVVFAALLAIRHHVPGTRIATDDDPDDHEPEYTYGIDLYRRTFPDRDATYTPDAGK